MKNAILVRRAVAPMDSGASASLLPADAEAEAVLTKIPLGEAVEIQVRRGRSLPQHRLFRALLRHVAKATVWETDERLLLGLKIYFGKCDRVMLPNGKAILVAHSTSFPEMDQAEFQEFMDQSIQVICERIIPGANSDELILEAQAMLGDTMIADIAPGGESHPHSEFGSPKSSTASERVERRDAPQESTLGWASTVVGTSESRSLSQTPPIVPSDTPPPADVIYPLPANIVPQKLPGGGFDWNGYAEAMIDAIPHADAAEIRRAKVSRYLGLLRTTKSGDLLWGQVMQALTGRLQDLNRTK
jgi:hypothetical protein